MRSVRYKTGHEAERRCRRCDYVFACFTDPSHALMFPGKDPPCQLRKVFDLLALMQAARYVQAASLDLSLMPQEAWWLPRLPSLQIRIVFIGAGVELHWKGRRVAAISSVAICHALLRFSEKFQFTRRHHV